MIKWFEKNRAFAVLFTIVFALGIFIISSIHGIRIPGGPDWDISVIYHLTIFFLFNFFFLISAIGKNKLKKKIVFLVLLTSLIYAVLDEFHQVFVPFRSASISDVIVDSLGIFLSTVIYAYCKK